MLPGTICARCRSKSFPRFSRHALSTFGAEGRLEDIIGYNMYIPVKLGTVCRKWSRIAWSSPQLWLQLLFRSSYMSYSRWTVLARDRIARSSALNLLLQSSERWHHITLRMEPEWMPYLRDQLKSRFTRTLVSVHRGD